MVDHALTADRAGLLTALCRSEHCGWKLLEEVLFSIHVLFKCESSLTGITGIFRVK